MGQQIECFTRIEGAFKMRYLAPCGWNTYPSNTSRADGMWVVSFLGSLIFASSPYRLINLMSKARSTNQTSATSIVSTDPPTKIPRW